jgi:hypothetical protein
VADGQGGRAGGAAASSLACRAAVEGAGTLPVRKLLAPATWATILRRADQAVADDPRAGFTTLVAFAVVGDAVCGASCGDSAAVASAGEGKPVILTGRQHKDPPVGSGAAPFVGFDFPLAAPWGVLALTDGVWKYAGWPAVLAAADLPPEEALAALRGRALLPGSGELPDDFTLVVVRG